MSCIVVDGCSQKRRIYHHKRHISQLRSTGSEVETEGGEVQAAYPGLKCLSLICLLALLSVGQQVRVYMANNAKKKKRKKEMDLSHQPVTLPCLQSKCRDSSYFPTVCWINAAQPHYGSTLAVASRDGRSSAAPAGENTTVPIVTSKTDEVRRQRAHGACAVVTYSPPMARALALQ